MQIYKYYIIKRRILRVISSLPKRINQNEMTSAILIDRFSEIPVSC